MKENMENKPVLPVKWLRALMYIAIVSFINSFFVSTSVATWISRGIMVAMIFCMFQLSPANERYRKAGILRAVMLACTLITAFIHQSGLLTLAASIASIFAVFQEYSGHSELIADKDAKLAAKWHSLFNWSIVVGVLVGLGSVITVMIVALTEVDTGSVTSLIVILLNIPQMVLNVVYVMYINKMIIISENDGVRKAKNEAEKPDEETD